MAIHGYDGVPGSGKTSGAVDRLYNHRLAGRPTFANIPLYDLRLVDRLPVEKRNDTRAGIPGVAYRRDLYGWPWSCYIENIEDLLSIRRGEVLIDEVDMWFSAVEWQRVSFDQRRFWTQHRKMGLNILWTCTYIDRVLNVIRDITELVFRCSKIPFVKNVSMQRMFNPQQTGTTRKTTMLRAVRLHPQLWELFPSDFIVGTGNPAGKNFRESERGAAGLSADVEVRKGEAEEIIDIAGTGKLYRPVLLGELQEVAPLITPQVCRELAVWASKRDCKAPKGERVAAARLEPILKRLRGER